jgi:alpha-N-arabinofuranosidase
MAWVAKAQVEPTMAVNLGSRELQEVCDLLGLFTHSARSALAEQRRKSGSKEPFDVKLWCVGNEVDGPWQLGHKTVDAYGALAAETVKAMRQVNPRIQLVVGEAPTPTCPPLVHGRAPS